MKSRWLRWALLALLLVAIGVLLRFTVLRQEPVPVTVYRVTRGTVEDSVTNSKAGTVRTRKRALLSPEIGGRVAELLVREGDSVRAGQVLLRLIDEDFRARLALQERAHTAARAARREACLTAEQAERDFRRSLRLAEERIVSQEMLDQAQNRRDVGLAACEAARAREEEAEAALGLARVELGKTVLRAPFDAVVAELSVEEGEWITPSPPGIPIPSVLELMRPDEIYISAPLDEVDVAKVRVGLPVRVTLDAYPGSSFAGRVSRVAPYVSDLEEHSRTIEIEVELDDPEFARTLLPGSSADVEVILRSTEDALRIPSYAVIEGRRVLVVEQDELVAREVETGLRNWAWVEIVRGLDEEEPVVVSLDRAEVQAGVPAKIIAESHP